MKYLMIYEAFKSDTIAKLNKFLGKKINKNASKKFISLLNRLLLAFDFPSSEIKDEDLKYLPSKKAIRIKAPDGWTPSSNDIDYDIYAFKFWFSLEKGFLGTTGIGSKTCYSENSNEPFDKNDLNYIKDNLGITKGELELVDNYSELKHGQEVIGYFSVFSHLDKLSKAKIYISTDGGIYAIQNVSNGNIAPGNNWEKWGRYSWKLASIDGTIRSDHHKLHIYNETEEEIDLRINDNKEENPLNYNLSLNRWWVTKLSDSENNSREILLDDSDFCIVFYIDNLIKRGYKKASEYENEREENREGAAALYSDGEIKRENIRRYMSEIISRMGIKKDSKLEDLKNLQRILKMSMSGRFPIYSLLDREVDASKFLKRIISFIYDIIRNEEYLYISSLETEITRREIRSVRKKEYFKKSENKIFNSSNKSLIDVFNIIKEINDDITDYINKQEINTLSDLESVYLKLEDIKNLFNSDNLSIILLLSYMDDDKGVNLYISYYGEKYPNDLKILKNFKNDIKNLLN